MYPLLSHHNPTYTFYYLTTPHKPVFISPHHICPLLSHQNPTYTLYYLTAPHIPFIISPQPHTFPLISIYMLFQQVNVITQIFSNQTGHARYGCKLCYNLAIHMEMLEGEGTPFPIWPAVTAIPMIHLSHVCNAPHTRMLENKR